MISDRNSRFLTIDQGNSSAKLNIWEQNNLIDSCLEPDLEFEKLVGLLDRYSPVACAYCSVSHFDTRLIESLRHYFGDSLLVLTDKVKLPFNVDYELSTLGKDRLAAVAGAFCFSEGENALIVDAGTAMTLDIMDRCGNYKGGNISPGLSMRFKSLNKETAKLPLVSFEGSVTAFGTTTESAIRDGVVNGMVYEILMSLKKAREIWGEVRIIATGRDAILLSEFVKKEGEEVHYCPDLVGVGLLRILKFNFPWLVA